MTDKEYWKLFNICKEALGDEAWRDFGAELIQRFCAEKGYIKKED